MERGKVRVVILGYSQAAAGLFERIVCSDSRFFLCATCSGWEACRDVLERDVPDVLLAKEGAIPSDWHMSSSSLLWAGESPTLEAISCSATAAGGAVPSVLNELSNIYAEVLHEKARHLRSLLTCYQDSLIGQRYVTKLKVRHGETELDVPLQQVEWIEGAGNWVRVHTPVGTYPVREMINEVMEKLPDTQFIRIHRSIVVNRSRIVEVTMQNDVPVSLLMQSGDSLNVGVTFRRQLVEKSLFHAQESLPT